MGQKIKILDLKENPGILLLKLGPAKIQTITHDSIHYYNLTPIAQEIDAIQNKYEAVAIAINNGLSRPYWTNLQNFIQGLQYQLEAVHRKFQSIYPLHRRKRALINALGSIVKAISGNLDQDDAEKYDSAIFTLQRNQVNVIQQMNRHVSLSTKLTGNFNTTVNLITHNQEVIALEIEKVHSELNTFVYNFNDYMITRNILDQLSLSLQITLQLLTDLGNAITFARMNTLHDSIIKPDELKSIIDTIIRNHQEEQLLYTYNRK
ncbi:hypothetical protein JTB14_029547 [Gonioctena quinquepunctata]|nr:hypothetical protein JTB14_029547 [Gonioctena quinquepunctata]